MARLGDICEKGTSNVAQKDLSNKDGGYPIYGASGLIKKVNFYHQDKPYIAIVKDGAGAGRVMQLPAKSSVIGTLQYIIPKNNFCIGYLAYAIEHMNLSKYCLGAAIPHIYFKDYCNEILPDYSLAEQQRIASQLDKISHLITLRKQQLSKLDELVKSRFVEMFGDGEVLGVRSQGLGSRGDKWPMVKIEEVGFITSGGTPSRARPEYYNGKIRWYSAGELNSLYLPDSVEHITEKALQESSAKLFKKGSLLIGMYDTAAFKMGILTEDASSNQACANLTPYEDYNVVWLYYLFEKMKKIDLLY